MKLENLHAHMHINALANGTAEVLFMGQPALSVSVSSAPTMDGQSTHAYHWVINPVFAKLSYGANVISDVPFCSQQYTSIEHAAAEGIAKLEEMGAFKTIVELPDDTYSNAQKYAEQDFFSHAISTKGSLSEAVLYINALELGSYKPAVKFNDLHEKVLSGSELSESEKIALFEYSYMGYSFLSQEIVSESASEEATGDQTVSERTLALVEYLKAEKRRIQLDEANRLVSTHDSGERSAKVYKCSETGEHIVKFFSDGKHHKEADYHTDDKHDAQGTAKHWISQLKKVDEAIHDDDYYVVDPENKTIVKRIGKPVKRLDPYSDPTNHPEFKSAISDSKHKVMRGMKAKFAGFLESVTKSEFDANNALADKRLTGKKSIRIIGPTGGTVSKHDTVSDAKRSFIKKKLDKKTHTIQETTDEGEVDITDLFESGEEDYNKWASEVQSKHGDKKIVIRHRVEKGVHTSSAEVPGEDRSYAVYDHDKNQGHIFEESEEIVGEEVIEERELTDSEKAKKEEIISAIKGRKGFTSRFGKDAINIVATQLAKTAGA